MCNASAHKAQKAACAQRTADLNPTPSSSGQCCEFSRVRCTRVWDLPNRARAVSQTFIVRQGTIRGHRKWEGAQCVICQPHWRSGTALVQADACNPEEGPGIIRWAQNVHDNQNRAQLFSGEQLGCHFFQSAFLHHHPNNCSARCCTRKTHKKATMFQTLQHGGAQHRSWRRLWPKGLCWWPPSACDRRVRPSPGRQCD